jgi:hypothetical protein
MSSRFGRNKRRRARAEIERLDAANGALRSRVQLARQMEAAADATIDRLKGKLRAAAELLGDQLVCFDAGLMEAHKNLRADPRLWVDVSSAFDAGSFDDLPFKGDTVVSRAALCCVVPGMVIDQLQDKVHFEVAFADGAGERRLAYAINASTIRGADHVLRARMAASCAEVLTEEFFKLMAERVPT